MVKGKRLKIAALSLALCLSLSLTSCQHAADPPELPIPVEIPQGQPVKHSPFQAALARFEGTLAGDVAADGVGAISAGVVVGEEVIWAKGFGWADVGKSIPADEKTIYRTGSISKSFTAVLMMQMVERDFIYLDDPVIHYFSEIDGLKEKPGASLPITFRQLASHTSGLEREPRLKGAAEGPVGFWEEKILTSIPQTFYLAKPGEKYSYSNIGYGILGLAVSEAVGQSFMELIKQNIFVPLGMDSSFFILTSEHLPHLSMGYALSRDGSVNADNPAREHAGRGYKVPNGGIYSTVGDLAKFIAALTGASSRKIFSEETRQEILKRQTPEEGAGYGLGFSIQTDDDGFTSYGHGGSVAGYNAGIVFDPQTDIGVVILRNYSRGRTNLGRIIQDR